MTSRASSRNTLNRCVILDTHPGIFIPGPFFGGPYTGCPGPLPLMDPSEGRWSELRAALVALPPKKLKPATSDRSPNLCPLNEYHLKSTRTQTLDPSADLADSPAEPSAHTSAAPWEAL